MELALAEHDPRLPLVIDPELVYSSYIGGNGDRSGPIQGFAGLPPQIASLMFSDAAIDLALGPDNTAYVTGLAYSSKFPTTPGAFQTVDQSTNTTPNGIRGQVRHHQERRRFAGLFDLPGRHGLQRRASSGLQSGSGRRPGQRGGR